jgi:hypothetical protein
MGTPGYMSPEQVRGLATDHRSDIFSFGVILHELLTGKRVFHAETSVETMAAILKQEAPELPETVPAGLQHIVGHCLEKDPANRFQSAKDLRFALQALTGSAITKSASGASAAPPKHRRRWLFAFAAAAAVIGGVILGAYVVAPPIDLGKQHRSGGEFVFVSDRGGEQGVWVSSADGSWERRVVAPRDLGGQGASEFRSPEYSPDGKRIVYIGGRRAWISPVSGGRPTPVTPDGEIAITPTWSADGLWIAYRVGTLLKKVRVGNPAAPVVIAETGAVPVVWSPDGKWITLGVNDGIGIVSPDGTQKRTLIKRPFGAYSSSIGWSRDGAVLYLLNKVGDHYQLSAIDVERGSERVIRDYPPSSFDYAELFLAAGRLYPSGDGRSLLATRTSFGSSVWMIEGVEPPLPLWRRLLRR